MGELIKLFPDFTIVNRSVQHYIGGPDHASFVVRMPAVLWAKYKRQKQLGQLYGVDISTAIGRANPDVRAYQPTVSDRRRASKGVKLITLIYPLMADTSTR